MVESVMFFKRKLILILASCMTLTSCHLPLNEKPPESQSMENKLGDEAKCLTSVLPTMSHFMDGSASPAQVGQIWDCFGTALDTFQKFYVGENPKYYKANEVKIFFERYFLGKDVKISPALLLEIMHLKQVFVGGEEGTLTKAEVKKLITFSGSIKRISLKLLPYMKVYAQKWNIQAEVNLDDESSYFEAANAALQVAVKDLAALIKENKKSYKVSNIFVLLNETSKLYNTHWAFLDNFNKFLPLIQEIKKSLTGGDADYIAATEWENFLNLVGRGYVQYLRYYYFIDQNHNFEASKNTRYVFDSIDDLFLYLADMVNAKPGKVLTADELYKLLKEVGVVFPKFQVTEELINQVMKVKKLIFGGSVFIWTPQEFKHAESKLVSYRKAADIFFEFSEYYLLDWKFQNVSEEDAFEYEAKAEKSLIDFAAILSSNIESNYNLNDVEPLFAEVQKFISKLNGDPETAPQESMVKKYLPLVISVKNVIASDTGPIIEKRQWPLLFDIIAKSYSRFTDYHYFISGRSVINGPALDWFNHLVIAGSEIVDKIITSRETEDRPGLITYPEIYNLEKSLTVLDIYPNKLTVDDIHALVKTVLSKILITPEKRLGVGPKDGLSGDATEVIRLEFKAWYESQKILNKMYDSYKDTNVLDHKTARQFLSTMPGSDSNAELVRLFESPLSYARDSEKRLFIAKEELVYDQKSLNFLNISRSASRLVGRSYAGDLKRAIGYGGISEKEANELYSDVKNVVVKLDYIVSSNTKFASNRFRDANLFSANANGDDFADFKELHSLVMLIFSGLNLNKKVTAFVSPACPVSPMWPTAKKVLVKCLIDVYREKMAGPIASIPEYLVKVQPLKEKDFQLNMIAILKAAGYVSPVTAAAIAATPTPSAPGPTATPDANKLSDEEIELPYVLEDYVDLDDAALAPHIMQYIETAMQKFDLNHDGIMDTQESLIAYPVFKNTLIIVSGKKDDPSLKAIFTYILKKGRQPTPLEFLMWKAQGESKWNVDADRIRLAKILGFIAEQLNKQP